MNMMKAWQVDYGGGMDSMRRVELPVPEPGPGQVLVRVRTVSLNRRELSILEGNYPLPVRDTLVPVSDGAGEIVAVGHGVPDERVGQRVLGAVFPHWLDGEFGVEVAAQLGGSLDGALAEYLCLDSEAALSIPDGMDYDTAASLPCAGVTAWHALTGIRSDTKVLSLTSGGVSSFAIQLAAALGATVIAGTASGRSAELARLGATHVVDTRRPLPEQVLELTGGRGADLVVHNYGPLDASVAATRVAGRVSLVAVQAAGQLDPVLAFGRNVTIRPIALGSVTHTRDLVDFVATHDLRPPVAARFGFDDAREAYAHYAEDRPFGKVLIEI